MTPQANFMILAPIVPSREAELRRLLASMNDAPGRVNPNNAADPVRAVRHAAFRAFADPRRQDHRGRAHLRIAGPHLIRSISPSSATSTAKRSLPQRTGEARVRRLARDLFMLPWIHVRHRSRGLDEALRSPAIAVYVNTRGRTVRQIREEAALQEAIESYLASQASSFEGLSPREIHAQLKRFVEAEKSAGRLTLSDEEATPLGWWIGKTLHLIGMPLLVLLAFAAADSDRSVLSVSAAPPGEDRSRSAYIVDRRRPLRDLGASRKITMSRISTARWAALKPGLVRRVTHRRVLLVTTTQRGTLSGPAVWGASARSTLRAGCLSTAPSGWGFSATTTAASRATWTISSTRLGFGLNAFSSNGIGYPRTNWLVLDGMRRRTQLQGVPATPHRADASLVQGLSRFDGDRFGKEHAHPSRIGILVDQRTRGPRMAGPAMTYAWSITRTCRVWCALVTVA